MGAPSMIESSEYFYTYKLNFSNFLFGIKYITATCSVLLAIIFVKFVFQSTSKFILVIVLFMIIIANSLYIPLFDTRNSLNI